MINSPISRDLVSRSVLENAERSGDARKSPGKGIIPAKASVLFERFPNGINFFTILRGIDLFPMEIIDLNSLKFLKKMPKE